MSSKEELKREASAVRKSCCFFCHQNCGVLAYVKDGRVLAIERGPEHPVSRGGLSRRFGDYGSAQRFLTGIRFREGEGTLDERDYRQDNPLGFTNLAEKWLESKKGSVRKGSFKNLNSYMRRTMGAWGR